MACHKLDKRVSQSAAPLQMMSHHSSEPCENLPHSDFHDTLLPPLLSISIALPISTNRPLVPHRGVGWIKPNTEEHFYDFAKISSLKRPKDAAMWHRRPRSPYNYKYSKSKSKLEYYI